MQLYDGFFKKGMTLRSVAKAVIYAFVPDEILDFLNFRTFKLCQTHFVSEEMQQSASDIVYSIQLRGHKRDVYFVFEHQSKADKTMPVRLLEYSCKLMRDHWHQGKSELAIIIPIVLYAGSGSYNYSAELARYTSLPELAEKILQYKFTLIDLSQYSANELMDLGEASSLLLALKLTRYNNFSSIKLFIATGVLKTLDENSRMAYYLNQYLMSITVVSRRKELCELVRQQVKKIGDDMISIYEGAIQEGMQKGMQKGMEEGMEAIQIRWAKNLLGQGFSAKHIREVTGISEKLLKSLKNKSKKN